VRASRAVQLPTPSVGRFKNNSHDSNIPIAKRGSTAKANRRLHRAAARSIRQKVMLVDGDIDPYNEQEGHVAVATRPRPNEDVDIIKNSKATLEPRRRRYHDRQMIIDATRPMRGRSRAAGRAGRGNARFRSTSISSIAKKIGAIPHPESGRVNAEVVRVEGPVLSQPSICD